MTFTVKLDLKNAVEQLRHAQSALSSSVTAFEQHQGAFNLVADGSSASEGTEAASDFGRCRQESESINAVIDQIISVVEQYENSI
ncbi:hypothetical protein [Haloglycomyces albus]|uniref:hypothetical protein n=1 Tax=Haloglycomyces albus TaxID=526067 RepID=UPI00046D37C4|nr:hypothetical protein [Haloglycomyces albus]